MSMEFIVIEKITLLQETLLIALKELSKHDCPCEINPSICDKMILNRNYFVSPCGRKSADCWMEHLIEVYNREHTIKISDRNFNQSGKELFEELIVIACKELSRFDCPGELDSELCDKMYKPNPNKCNCVPSICWGKYLFKELDCFTPNSKPYPLCDGRDDVMCKKCSLYEDMEEPNEL